jgi:hypothetical protein
MAGTGFRPPGRFRAGRGRRCRTLAGVVHRPARPASPLGQRAATALVVVSLALGLVRLAGELADQSDHASAPSPRVVDELPLLPSVGEESTRFLAFARRTIPAGESVRIVQRPAPPSRFETRRSGATGVCGYRAVGLTYFWLVYALSPRPSTCDPNAQWTVYYGVRPPPLPSGRRVYPFAPDYAVFGP